LAASQKAMPYQRGQFWIRRFRQQAERLCAALAALTAPLAAPDFVARALRMLQCIGWIAAHRFLFAGLRFHLLGWPAFLAPNGRIAAFRPAAPPAGSPPHSFCLEAALPSPYASGSGRSSPWMPKLKKSPCSVMG
jgi:hypothetical protein